MDSKTDAGMPRTHVPVIGVPADRREIPPHFFHAIGEKYLLAVVDGAGGLPFPIPALGDRLSLDDIVSRVDGLMLTGSPSNVEPQHYAGTPSDPGTLHDPARDATTLPLIRAAIEAAVPVLAICRGFQELNVVFGGSLHQKVQEVPGKMDHREDKSSPLDSQYAPAHEVELAPAGVLAHLAKGLCVRVNSLHSQGVDRLGDGLVVEATAPDGLIEAFRVRDASTFALGVQWHPEWKVTENPFSLALFQAFGVACRERRERRHIPVQRAAAGAL